KQPNPTNLYEMRMLQCSHRQVTHNDHSATHTDTQTHTHRHTHTHTHTHTHIKPARVCSQALRRNGSFVHMCSDSPSIAANSFPLSPSLHPSPPSLPSLPSPTSISYTSTPSPHQSTALV